MVQYTLLMMASRYLSFHLRPPDCHGTMCLLPPLNTTRQFLLPGLGTSLYILKLSLAEGPLSMLLML